MPRQASDMFIVDNSDADWKVRSYLKDWCEQHWNETIRLMAEVDRGGEDAWRIRVSTPKSDPCLQAVDYFLWAVQRFYEPRDDSATGLPKHEERFLNPSPDQSPPHLQEQESVQHPR